MVAERWTQVRAEGGEVGWSCWSCLCWRRIISTQLRGAGFRLVLLLLQTGLIGLAGRPDRSPLIACLEKARREELVRAAF